MDSCNFTNEANSHAFEVEIYTLQKLCHFGRYDSKAKLFCRKSFVPVTRAGVLIWENFHPVYRDLGRPKVANMPFSVPQSIWTSNGRIAFEEETCCNNHPPHILSQGNTSGNVGVKSKLRHPPREYPGHLTPFPAREGGNLIILVFPGRGI